MDTKSLKITIIGYGLGLGIECSSTLASTNLEEYQDVMNFSFKVFIQREDIHNIGMVYGFKLVPLVDNTSFLLNSCCILSQDNRSSVSLSRVDSSRGGCI